MGLLDEAIRDHLDLKRRHGADPGEVERLEHEALGPARREPAVAAPVQERAESVYDVDEDLEDEVPADERLESRGAAAESAPATPPAREPEPEPAPEPEAPVTSVDQPTREFSIEELEEAEREPPPDAERPDPPRGDAAGAKEKPHPDDVLEETPEFLSETPEHDRLWFEQKPPRDFDF